MTKTTRRGKTERENVLDKKHGVGRSKYKMSSASITKARKKALWNGHILKMARRIGKLELAKLKVQRLLTETAKPIPMFGVAMRSLEEAISYGIELIRVASPLMALDVNDPVYPQLEERFQTLCARFSGMEHRAYEALHSAERNKEHNEERV